MYEPKPLWEVSRQLTATAAGREPADLVVKNARLVNVCTGEVLPGTDVAVRAGRVAFVGDAGHCVGAGTRVEDAQGRYLTPGFLDGHMHVESSMMTVGQYARATLPHGTTGIFPDPHEIVNVAGLAGMRAMQEDAATTPQRAYFTTPSCVPAAPGLEHTGGRVTARDVAESMGWPGVAGLGEMMDVRGVLEGDADVHARIGATLRARRPVTGHFPLEDTGAVLNAYAASGVSSCHESTRPEEVLAKLRLGMYAMVREGSAWDDLPATIRAVTERRLDTRHVLLVSDDLHADTLLTKGHMDYIVRMAIRCGVPPVTAVQMATLNTADYFGLSQDIGAVAPGRLADFLLLDDLAEVTVRDVYVGGMLAARDGALCCETFLYAYPQALYHTVHLPRALTPADFTVPTPKAGVPQVKALAAEAPQAETPQEALQTDAPKVKAPEVKASEVRAPKVEAPRVEETAAVRVIRVRGGNVLTEAETRTLPVENGAVRLPGDEDICKAAVLGRHGQGTKAFGFAAGFGFARGAVASTYAHDAHNLLVMGKNDADMALAANTLLHCGGGMCAVADGEVLACVELPIAGLMNDRPAAESAAAMEELAQAWRVLGCALPSPFMTASLLSLSVIPSLRLTDMGLVDVKQGKLVSLFVQE